MLTRFNFISTKPMMVKMFGLSLGFQGWADFKRVFNNLSIIKNWFYILNNIFKSVVDC